MKLKLFFIGLLFATCTLNAQFIVETHSGEPIEDGDIFTFGEVGAELPFYVYNTSSSDINMKIQFADMENGEEDMIELCFGLCYTGLNLGEFYPGNMTGITIPPGEHQASSGDHILNTATGNGSEVLDYVFKFYQVDDVGHPIGEPLVLTYRYDPLLAVEEINNLDIAVYPTVVQNFLTIETGEALDMEVYNLQGRLVKSETLLVGQNRISMANLASQMYLLRFENKFGQVKTTKVIVE